MQIKKGQNRIVLLFPSVKIVIKVPIIHLLTVIHSIFINRRRRDWKFLRINITSPLCGKYRGYRGYRAYLFLGIVCNWNEFWFFWKTRNFFLQPTYFSFFGLFNIQKLGIKCAVTRVNLWDQLKIISDKLVEKDYHHFSVPKNFTLDKGKLRILDYGDQKTQEIILECGKKIFNEFNPNYDWKKRMTAQFKKK